MPQGFSIVKECDSDPIITFFFVCMYYFKISFCMFVILKYLKFVILKKKKRILSLYSIVRSLFGLGTHIAKGKRECSEKGDLVPTLIWY